MSIKINCWHCDKSFDWKPHITVSKIHRIPCQNPNCIGVNFFVRVMDFGEPRNMVVATEQEAIDILEVERRKRHK